MNRGIVHVCSTAQTASEVSNGFVYNHLKNERL